MVIGVELDEPADALEAFFVPDGDSFLPSALGQGPWGRTLGGHVVGGLLGWAIEHASDANGLQLGRLTVDLLRPVLLEPVQIATSVQRDGRRLRLIDATLIQSGRQVARASALLLRSGEHPDGEVWSTQPEMPPLDDRFDRVPADVPIPLWIYGRTQEGKPGVNSGEWDQSESPKFVWAKFIRPVVQGFPVSPLVRLALAGDITSALTHWGTGGLRYINADFTVTASRLPEGEFVGLAATSHFGSGGVATGAATMFDIHGPIGSSTAVALAQPADAFQPVH